MDSNKPSGLILACIAGDERAIESLVRLYETDVFRLAYSILGDESEASEAAQETFIAALKSLKSYREKTSFKAWLFAITVNASRTRLRRQKVFERLKSRLVDVFRADSQKQVLPEDRVIQDEAETAIWNSLDELDEKHRMVVVLKYFHDLTVAEISEILSVNEGTIHSRLHYAREKLKDALAQLHGE